MFQKLIAGVVGLVLIAGTAHAVPIIDTTSAAFGGVGQFGEPSITVLGQTFTVTGPETQLDSFSFHYDDGFLGPDFIDFAGYLYAWDGSKAVGPQLFVSAGMSSTNNGGAGGFELFSFDTGVQLVDGAQYVAFLSSLQYFDGIAGTANSELSDSDVYSGGRAVWNPTLTSFEDIFATPWLDFTGRDLWFIATFSEPLAVPEPPAVAFFAAGLLSLLLFRRQIRT